MAERHLRVIDAQGQVFDECPTCLEWQRKYNGLLSQLGQLRRDRDNEAKQHELWPQAVELFHYWQMRSHKSKARWTSDRFWMIEPFLREEGYDNCRWALEGLCSSEYHVEHDYLDFWRPFQTAANGRRSQDNFERFRDMGAPPQEVQDFFKWYDRVMA